MPVCKIFVLLECSHDTKVSKFNNCFLYCRRTMCCHSLHSCENTKTHFTAGNTCSNCLKSISSQMFCKWLYPIILKLHPQTQFLVWEVVQKDFLVSSVSIRCHERILKCLFVTIRDVNKSWCHLIEILNKHISPFHISAWRRVCCTPVRGLIRVRSGSWRTLTTLQLLATL